MFLLNPVLHDEARMGKRYDRIKKVRLFINGVQVLEIFSVAKAKCHIAMNSELQLFLHAFNNKWPDPEKQSLIIVIIEVFVISCETERTDRSNIKFAVEAIGSAESVYHIIDKNR